MIYQLLLLMYLGRQHFRADEFPSRYDARKETIGDRQEAVSQLMCYAVVLADQLHDGLEELRIHGLDVDKMPLKKVRVRKR